MKNNPNLEVVVSNRNVDGWQVFRVNKSEGFVFGVEKFTDRQTAMERVEYLADQYSCIIEVVEQNKTTGSVEIIHQ